ncbi:protein ecdysoneless homolog isoform X2 [Cryptomeria japonica]|uniref:protein ecdysoneless homolog isoform X2 n=1 Tax=Cryptomeria japonica TaxID=3369 RepID=UPI0027DA6752|nr:protein ecdysoneless homolog isoform X2 [Cryptomeria japonica]
MDEDYGGRKGKAKAPEDTLLYSIFPDFALTESTSPEQVESKLKELQVNCLDIVSPFVKDYIWQHDSFNLQSSATTSTCPCTSSAEDSNSSPSVPHLHGRLKYGDNVDDEWFVVFLLYEITRKMPYVSARAWDTDGEFLLIEAAYALPRWLKPENSSNRVFIRHGELHILPLPASPAEIYRFPVKPSVADSLRVLSGGFLETRARDAVQDILNARVGGFPARAVENMHSVRVRVPVRVAQVLKHEPQLISKAVEGFYDRDVDSMKAAAKMEKFLGEKEMVDVCVTMSRAMYAQLVQQVFQAPRCYPMPPLSSPIYREAGLGMKISCGFEMIYYERSQYQPHFEDVEPGLVGFSDAAAKSSNLKAAQNKDIGWEAFRKSLGNKGYFKCLLEGSNEYRRLMNDALDYYRSTTLFSRTSMVMHAPVRCINEILALPHSSADFIGLELPPSDDDSWLYNGEEDLNAALLERQKEMDLYEEHHRNKQSKKPKEDSTSRKTMDDFNLEDIAKNMHAFVENMSSYEGAELPRNENSETVSLDMRQFLKELKSAVGANTKCVSTQENYLDDSGCSSSDMDFDENESDTCESIGLEETDEQVSMTKDNDGPSDTFMNEYSDMLKEQLNDTTLAKSFVRPEDLAKLGDKNKVNMLIQDPCQWEKSCVWQTG